MTAAQAVLLAVVVLPATVGAVLALTRAERAAAPVAVATAAVTTVLAAVAALARPALAYPFVAGADFALEADALAALTLPMVAGVTLLVLVFAAGSIRAARPRFHGLMLLFAAAALTTVTAASLPALLFAWELMGATSYALIGFWWRDADRVSAGLTAFITTRTADLGLYVAAGAALAGGAGMALSALPAAESPWRHVIAAGILVAALGKAAQLPFSFWLSGAMKGPSPVSALLHSAAMVAMGGYLLLRVEPLLASTGWAGPAAAWIGAVTAVLMGFVALAQRELKQLLAASTVAQLGFVVLAAGVGAVSGGAAHLVAHASTKALLFLAAGAWLTALGTEELAALRRGRPPVAGRGRERDRGGAGPGRDRPTVPVGHQGRGAGRRPRGLGVALRRRARGGGPVGGLRGQGPVDDLVSGCPR
ncbi:proton-conducting transporter transmembrane domain-containing protein [Kocuria marina]|uniref:proton-conducting transporter transmembrane domain-containing protein n=1 Tax=Kocuria marina TaxID=223184 RepID=UPI00272E3B55